MIHTKSQEVNEERIGRRRARMMQRYYEQNQREQLLRQCHRLSSPMYIENINQLNSTLGQSTINADCINFQGDTLNINGILEVNGKLMIGHPIGPRRPLPFAMMKRSPRKLYHPKLHNAFLTESLQLPPYETPTYRMEGTVTISGKGTAINKQVIAPVNAFPKRNEMSVQLQKAIQDYFAGLQITATTEKDDLKLAPGITVGNKQGDYTFEQGVLLGPVGVDSVVFEYTGTSSVKKSGFELWDFDLEVEMLLKITMTRKNSFEPSKAIKNFATRSVESFIGEDAPSIGIEAPAVGDVILARFAILDYLAALAE